MGEPQPNPAWATGSAPCLAGAARWAWVSSVRAAGTAAHRGGMAGRADAASGQELAACPATASSRTSAAPRTTAPPRRFVLGEPSAWWPRGGASQPASAGPAGAQGAVAARSRARGKLLMALLLGAAAGAPRGRLGVGRQGRPPMPRCSPALASR